MIIVLINIQLYKYYSTFGSFLQNFGYIKNRTSVGGVLMEDKKIEGKKKLTEEERKELAEQFWKTIDSKLRKEEKRTWMLRDLDHLHQYDD